MDNAHILKWFQFADMDLAAAEHLLSLKPTPYEIICFHCQQSAEKCLKGYLIYKGIEAPPKIHDLNKLCDLCAEFDNGFDDILDACEYLTQFGVQPRYPDEIEIDEHYAKKAVKYAKEVKEFAPLIEVRKEVEEVEKED